MINRIVALLKPGGWLIIEEHDPLERDSEGRLGPMASHLRLLQQQEEMFRQSGRDLGIAQHIERILRETGMLHPVTACRLDVPFMGYTDGKPGVLNVEIFLADVLPRRQAQCTRRSSQGGVAEHGTCWSHEWAAWLHGGLVQRGQVRNGG